MPALASGLDGIRGSTSQHSAAPTPLVSTSQAAADAPILPTVPASIRPSARTHPALPTAQSKRTHYEIPAAGAGAGGSGRGGSNTGSGDSGGNGVPDSAGSPARQGNPAHKRAGTSSPTTHRKHSTSRPAHKPQHKSAGYTESSYAYRVLSQLNSERARHGARALSMNGSLISSAHAHNLAMARADEMSHQLPGEAFFGDRILRAGYSYRDAGENIGWNSGLSSNAACALETTMYAEGAPPKGQTNHYSNIVSKKFTNVGIDVYIDTVHHKLWLTEDFGDR